MDLPVMPPVRPMLAKSVKGIPEPAKYTVDGIEGLSFEPKWDGFRCLVFKDGDEVELTSRNTKPLTRYFPEVVTAMREQLPDRIVLDGEIFVALRGDDGVDRLEFEVLQERIHPAQSRVEMLAEKTPAGFVAFDLLALGDTSYVERGFADRRAALEEAIGGLDLREVPGQRLGVAAGQLDLVAVLEHQAAEPVPLGLEAQPAVELGRIRDPFH